MSAAEIAARDGIQITYGRRRGISIMGGQLFVVADRELGLVKLDGVPKFGAFLTVARAELLIAALRDAIAELR